MRLRQPVKLLYEFQSISCNKLDVKIPSYLRKQVKRNYEVTRVREFAIIPNYE